MLGILVLSHGSRRKEYNDLLRQFAYRLKEKYAYSPITMAYMEFDTPSFGQGVKDLVREGARKIVVVPLFLAPGNHMIKDIPKEIAEIKEELGEIIEITLASYIGVDERVVDILHDRIQEAL